MKTTITGNIGRIDARYTPKGTFVIDFSVAENRQDAQGKEYTNWYNIVAWAQLAEDVSQACKKGTFVQVEAFKVESQHWMKGSEPQSKVVFTAGDVSVWTGGKKVDGGHFVSVKESGSEGSEDDEAPQESPKLPW